VAEPAAASERRRVPHLTGTRLARGGTAARLRTGGIAAHPQTLYVPDLEKTDPGSVEFGGRAKVLKELVDHHADEEEELFRTARKLFSKDELKELGERMQQRKEELVARAAR
jgi:hypothetical protein